MGKGGEGAVARYTSMVLKTPSCLGRRAVALGFMSCGFNDCLAAQCMLESCGDVFSFTGRWSDAGNKERSGGELC